MRQKMIMMKKKVEPSKRSSLRFVEDTTSSNYRGYTVLREIMEQPSINRSTVPKIPA